MEKLKSKKRWDYLLGGLSYYSILDENKNHFNIFPFKMISVLKEHEEELLAAK